jgi:hypothetical protein
MTKAIRILLQTTIPGIEDDWNIERFSLLRAHLASLKDAHGKALFDVTARNRETNAAGDDPVLSVLDATGFDELWLFAVDTGDGLTTADCRGITRFRERGRGILATRDHQDLGSSLCALGGIGRAHFFHSRHQDPDESRHVRDDEETETISWPNYHSGNNGDYQRVTCIQPIHEVLRNPDSAAGVIEYFPAHPHEGSVGVPEGEAHARVIATGVSQVTHRPFNLLVAFERALGNHGNALGRAVVESSFHHFADYNWDITKGCPTFVAERPGEEVGRRRARLADVKRYVRNIALWLAP